MKGIVDSNVIFSALISGDEKYLQVFRSHSFYIPDIVLLELDKYENRINWKNSFGKKCF